MHGKYPECQVTSAMQNNRNSESGPIIEPRYIPVPMCTSISLLYGMVDTLSTVNMEPSFWHSVDVHVIASF